MASYTPAQLTSGNADDFFAEESGNLPWGPDMVVRPVPQSVVVSFAPGKHTPVTAQSHRKLRPALNLRKKKK